MNCAEYVWKSWNVVNWFHFVLVGSLRSHIWTTFRHVFIIKTPAARPRVIYYPENSQRFQKAAAAAACLAFYSQLGGETSDLFNSRKLSLVALQHRQNLPWLTAGTLWMLWLPRSCDTTEPGAEKTFLLFLDTVSRRVTHNLHCRNVSP